MATQAQRLGIYQLCPRCMVPLERDADGDMTCMNRCGYYDWSHTSETALQSLQRSVMSGRSFRGAGWGDCFACVRSKLGQNGLKHSRGCSKRTG